MALNTKKVSKEKIKEAVWESIDKKATIPLEVLVGESRRIGFESKEIKEIIYRIFLENVKVSMSAETFKYVQNSFSMIRRLYERGIFDQENIRGFAKALSNGLKDNLKTMWEYNKTKTKDIGLRGMVDAEEFASRLKMAKESGVFGQTEMKRHVQDALELMHKWVEMKKIQEFTDLAQKITEAGVLQKGDLAKQFRLRIVELMREGSERMFNEKDKKNKNLKLELNSYNTERELYELLELKVIEDQDAEQITRSLVEKKIIGENFKVPKIRQKSKESGISLVEAVDNGDLKSISKFAKRES